VNVKVGKIGRLLKKWTNKNANKIEGKPIYGIVNGLKRYYWILAQIGTPVPMAFLIFILISQNKMKTTIEQRKLRRAQLKNVRERERVVHVNKVKIKSKFETGKFQYLWPFFWPYLKKEAANSRSRYGI